MSDHSGQASMGTDHCMTHTHFLYVFFSGHPYLMFKASWNSHFSFVHVKLSLDLGEVRLSGKKGVVSSLDRLVATAARATLPISHSSQLKCIDHMTLPNMIYKFCKNTTLHVALL